MEKILEQTNRLSQQEFETFIQSRGWQVLRDELTSRLKTAENKLKHTSRHLANYPTVSEFAATVASQGAICESIEKFLRLPAELLERSPHESRASQE